MRAWLKSPELDVGLKLKDHSMKTLLVITHTQNNNGFTNITDRRSKPLQNGKHWIQRENCIRYNLESRFSYHSLSNILILVQTCLLCNSFIAVIFNNNQLRLMVSSFCNSLCMKSLKAVAFSNNQLGRTVSFFCNSHNSWRSKNFSAVVTCYNRRQFIANSFLHSFISW